MEEKDTLIKCFKCVSCLDLGTCENPKKKTSITDCFCHRGHWDGVDFLGEDLSDWDYNKCEDFKDRNNGKK